MSKTLRRRQEAAPIRLPRALVGVDHRVIDFTRRYSLPILRVALGVVFLWFGLLKVYGVSPVADLVIKTAWFLPPPVAVMGMGIVETVIGVGLLTGAAIRLTLLLFFVQMCATFLTVVMRPDLLIVGHDPLVLSMDGEFVLKNIVLIAAGLVIVASVRKATPGRP